jgi:hypothetical protein
MEPHLGPLSEAIIWVMFVVGNRKHHAVFLYNYKAYLIKQLLVEVAKGNPPSLTCHPCMSFHL